MRWAQANVEKPDKPGQYHCFHPRMGKVVMGWDGTGWGPQSPDFWLQNDGNPHQNMDGSF